MDPSHLVAKYSRLPRQEGKCFSNCFVYQSQLTSGSDTELSCWSPGDGYYFEGTPDLAKYDLCFGVHKSHDDGTLYIYFHEGELLQLLREVIPLIFSGHQTAPLVTVNFRQLLPHYPSPKAHLDVTTLASTRNGPTGGVIELHLFVLDFLLERSIFESFGFESLYEQDVLTQTQWQDMLKRSTEKDLDFIDDCVATTSESGAELQDEEPEFSPPSSSYGWAEDGLGNKRSCSSASRSFEEPKLNIEPSLIDADILVDPLLHNNQAASFSPLDSGYDWTLRETMLLIMSCDESILADLPSVQDSNIDVLRSLADRIDYLDVRMRQRLFYVMVKKGFIDMIKDLSNHEAKLDHISRRRLIYVALVHQQVDIAVYLVKHNGNLDVNLRRGIIEFAKKFNLLDAQKHWNDNFLRKWAIRPIGYKWYTPLLYAAQYRLFNVAEFLVENGADVNEHYFYSERPVEAAASNGHLDIVKYLLDQGADTAWHHYDGGSLLGTVVANGHLDVFTYLLDQAADMVLDFNYSVSLLGTAVANGHRDIVKYLVSKIYLSERINQAVDLSDDNAVNGAVDYLRQIDREDRIGSCPITAAVHARDRSSIGRKMLTELANSNHRLLSISDQAPACNDLQSFVGQLGSCKYI